MVKVEKRTLRSKQVNLITYTGTTQRIELPRDKFVRRIYLRQYGDLDIDTLGTPVPSPVPSLISKIRLIKNGSETIVEGDPSWLMAMDYVEHGGAPNNTVPHKKIGDSQYWQSTLVLDFMINPMNENEFFVKNPMTGKIITVMLPTSIYSSFVLEIDIDASLATNALAGLYDTTPTTISDGTALLDITLEEVFREAGDVVITPNDVFELRTIQHQKALGVSLVDHPYEVTTGVFMRRIAMFQNDVGSGVGNPKRPAQGVPMVDRFKLQQTSPVSWNILDMDFGALQAEDMREYNVRTMERRSIAAGNVVESDHDTGVLAGFTMLDFDNGRNLYGGLDLVGMKSGDITLYMRTTAAAATTDYIFMLEQYII